MIAWMLYAALVGAIVAVGGLALERLAAAMGRPRRVAWLAALTLAVAIPLAGIWRPPRSSRKSDTIPPVTRQEMSTMPSNSSGNASMNCRLAAP